MEPLYPMSPEDRENPATSTESTDGNADLSRRISNLESLLASIRLASWISAIGILALVVYTVN
jgi:hypothetical protein